MSQTTTHTRPRAADRAANLPAQIAEKVRLLITRGTLAPGLHLGQAELAEMFAASRVPVREALKRLAAEGVVTHDPNRGFFIATLSSDEARQLYRLRHILEAAILAALQWPNDLQLSSLARMVAQAEALRDSGDYAEWAIKHREFHRAVFDLSPEKFMVSEALRLWHMADRYRSLMIAAPERRPYGKGESSDRHLLTALKSRDRERLLTVFHEDRTHIEDTLVATLKSRGL